MCTLSEELSVWLIGHFMKKVTIREIAFSIELIGKLIDSSVWTDRNIYSMQYRNSFEGFVIP